MKRRGLPQVFSCHPAMPVNPSSNLRAWTNRISFGLTGFLKTMPMLFLFLFLMIPHVHRQHTTTICRSILSPAVPCAESNW